MKNIFFNVGLVTVNIEIQVLCFVEHKSVIPVLVCQFISFINLADFLCVSIIC